MQLNYGIDMEKSFQEMFDMQKKFIKGMENLASKNDIEVDATPKELVYKEDKMKLYHYKPVVAKPHATPVLIVYALVNRQYMTDLQQDRSMIKGLLEQGLDVYIIDWGYPTREDMYLTMEDYINGYISNCVEVILKAKKLDSLSLIGICQGGTFSAIFAALHPKKVKNLVTMVAPIEFDIEDGLLFKWSKHFNVEKMVDVYGNIPADSMNLSFTLLKPFQLTFDKYIFALENMDDVVKTENFMRMEKWIFDSPDQAGATFKQFIKDLYQDNKLVKGTLEIGGEKVDLKKIDMPLLNIYGEFDHIVPPAASIPLNDHVSSKDKDLYSFAVGHIGMYVSSRSQKEVTPKLAKWLVDRSN